MALHKDQVLWKKARVAYYDGKPIMSDAEFDRLEESLRKRFPSWSELDKTGSGTMTKRRSVNLPVPLPSLTKVYDDQPNQIKRKLCQADEWVLMPKIDGNSALIQWRRGKLVRAITRGDGETGKDITELVRQIPGVANVPSFVDRTLRVEIVLPRNVWSEKWSKEFDNPRNQVAGVLNRKTPHASIQDFTVLVLEDLRSTAPLEKALQTIEREIGKSRSNMAVVAYQTYDNRELSVDLLQEQLNDLEGSAYDYDGLVLHANVPFVNRSVELPKHAFAFKLRSIQNAVKVKVLDVEWDVSQNGRLVPRVRIKPTRIGDVEVQFITGNNAAWVHERGINTGSVVEVVRAGDVIPKIVNVVKRSRQPKAEPKVNDRWVSYEWDDNGTHIYTTEHKHRSRIKAKQMLRSLRLLGVDFLALSGVLKLQDVGIESVLDLLQASDAHLLEVEGWKERTVQRLRHQIDRVKTEPHEPTALIAAWDGWNENMGRRRFEQIEQAHPGILQKILAGKTAEVRVRPKGVPQFVIEEWNAMHCECYITWLNQVNLPFKKASTASNKPANGKLKDTSVLFTGYRDKQQEERLVNLGAKIATTLSSKVTYLLYRPGGKASSKIEKAKSLGIKVMTYEQLVSR